MSPSDSPVPSGGSQVPGVPARGEHGPLVFHGKARRRRRRIIGAIAAALAVVVIAAAVLVSVLHAIVFRQVGIGPVTLLPVGGGCACPLRPPRSAHTAGRSRRQHLVHGAG